MRDAASYSTIETRLLVTRYGRLAVPTGDVDLIADFLSRYGEWSWLEVECLRERLPRDARVLDGGAYVGTFGLGLAQLRALRQICFVEANTLVVPMLRENVARCCHVPHAVLSACIMPLDGLSPPTGHAEPTNLGSACFTDGTAASSDAVLLPPAERAVSLESLLKQYGAFDLIKLDLEGAEAGLLSADGVLDLVRDADLWVECLADEAALGLAGSLLAAGRRLWYFAWPAFNPDNYIGEPDSRLPFAYESALLLEAVAGDRTPIDECALPTACIRRPIGAIGDLRTALWLTPRFAPPGWEALDREALAAVAAHEMADERYEDFLAAPGRCWSSPVRRARAALDRRDACSALSIARES